MSSKPDRPRNRIVKIALAVVITFALTPILIVVGSCIFVICWVPRGAEFGPYLSSFETERYETRFGSDLIVRMNDAGAMHSGSHWVFVEYNGRIVAEGYPTNSYPEYKLVEWIDREGGIFRVALSQEKSADASRELTVNLGSLPE